MRVRASRLSPWLALAAIAGLAGCETATDVPMKPTTMRTNLPASRAEPPSAFAHRAPDFSLQDVNPNSKTRDQMVSPRQHLGRISAWYFGHST